jgi:hypothetical protein
MAITITAVPSANLHTLSDNPMMFYMSSTNVTQENFSLIVKVYAGGSLYSTHQIFPKPNNTMSFDASGIARAVCAVLLRRTVLPTTPANFWFTLPNQPTQIYITAQERYGVNPELQGSIVTSNTVHCWKGRLKELQFTLWNGLLTRYQSEQTSRGLMLTDFPRNDRRIVTVNEPFYLGTYVRNPTDTETGYNCYRLTFYNSSNSIITTKQVRIGNALIDNGLYMPDLSLGHLVASGLITQTQADDTYLLRIGMAYIVTSVSQSSLGEFMNVYPFRGCNFGQTIYFLNRYGQFDSFPFIKRTISSTGVKGASAETYNDTLSVTVDGEYDYIRIAENRIKLKTDWLSQGVYNWLRRELIESPYILTYIDGVLCRCKVMASTSEQKQHELDIMFDFEVDLQVSLKDYSMVV